MNNKSLLIIIIVLVIGVAGLVFVSMSKQDNGVGKSITEVTEEISDQVNDGSSTVGEKIDEVGEEIKDEIDDHTTGQ